MPDEKMLKKLFIAKNEVDEDERTITAVISTNVVDRDGEVLLPAGAILDSYLKNPVVLWAHQYNEPPIAKSLWIKKGRKNITAKMKFATTVFADEIYQLYKGGFLNAFSVGFQPDMDKIKTPKEEDIRKHPEWAGAKRIFTEWEFLEYSGAPVPTNPEALALAVKNKSITISKKLIDELDIDEEQTFTCSCETIKSDSLIGKSFDELIAAGCVEITKELVLKPFPNEHSCRLKDPGQYERFARKNCEQKVDSKCIDVIYGIKEGKAEIQALRFPKDVWTAEAARSVCSSRGGSFEAASEKMIDTDAFIVTEPIIVTDEYIDIKTLAIEAANKMKGIVYM